MLGERASCHVSQEATGHREKGPFPYIPPWLEMLLTLNFSFLESPHLCQGVKFLGGKMDTVI